jgi:hemolysin activation/secretion protein
MSKNKNFLCVMLALSHSVFAAQPPSAGSQLQEIPPTPVQQKSSQTIQLEQASVPVSAESGSVKINVKSLKVTGAQAYSEADLLLVTGFKPESELTLSQLRSMASRIADFYHRNGYFVAQTFLPAQDINNGVVTIAVIEGHYGNVTLRNQTSLNASLVNGMLGGLNSGDLISSAPLENRLLLLYDLPGVKVKSTLLPGASVGASDLIVDVTPGRRVTGSVDADNGGNRYTGTNRIGATVNLNNPANHGDIAALRVLTSGSGLNYGRASYQMQFAKAKAGVAYTRMGYQLGEEFSILRADGNAQITSIYGNYMLIRSRNDNLSAQITYDNKAFQDKTVSTSPVNDKRVHVLMTSLIGDHRDTFSGGGVGSYSFTWSVGNIDIQTPAMLSLDAMTAQSNGQYNKLGFSVTRLQNVTETFTLNASVNGQFASKNLDVSEKMELGGMAAVRAYPEGEAYADQGYVLNLEAGKLLPKLSERLLGQVQLIGFVDTGTVTVNKNPWAAGTNLRTLSSAGAGFNWTGNNSFVVKAYYAHKLGDAVSTSAPDSSGRIIIRVVKYF